MKNNMLPFMGIAFIVAIISTGVFYGLFAGKLRSSSDLPGHAIVVAARDLDRGTVLQASDLRVAEVPAPLEGAFANPKEAAGATLLVPVKSNEPLLEERVSPKASAAGPAGLVPSGMRAVTVHIVQSESLLAMLRPASRVDLQAVSEGNGPVQLRTVLENIEVLAPNVADNHPGSAAITVLVRAEDADLVALADAGSHMRISLRNHYDDGHTPQHALALNAVFSDAHAQAEAHAQETKKLVAHVGRGR